MEFSLKLVELKAKAEALENGLTEASSNADFDAVSNAWRDVFAEEDKARALEKRFNLEYADWAAWDSGMTNARDTAVQYSLYEKHGEMVERSAEFWQCAIDSAQMMRDCGQA